MWDIYSTKAVGDVEVGARYPAKRWVEMAIETQTDDSNSSMCRCVVFKYLSIGRTSRRKRNEKSLKMLKAQCIEKFVLFCPNENENKRSSGIASSIITTTMLCRAVLLYKYYVAHSSSCVWSQFIHMWFCIYSLFSPSLIRPSTRALNTLLSASRTAYVAM